MTDQIVLINNDGYGAPELKRLSPGFTLKGFIIAVTIHFMIIAAYMLFAYLNEAKAKVIPVGNTPPKIVEIELPPSLEEELVPPEKKEEVSAPVKNLSALQPKPVSRDLADDVKLKTQDELNKITGNVSSTGDSLVASLNNTGITVPDDIIKDKIDNVVKDIPKDVYTSAEVDVAPECINLGTVRSSMVYPDLAITAGIEGKVTVKVLVGTNGNILKLGSVSGPDIFHDEVKEKAGNLKFTPGLQSNKPVKVWISVPFSFKLK
jgi:TonB family protein